jgi:rhodanese-related sulfurtransferase
MTTALARVVAALLLLGVAVLGTVSCGSDDQPTGTPATSVASGTPAAGDLLDPAAFAVAIGRRGTTVLDVRTPAEFASGHLAGAVNLDVQAATFADAVAGLDPAGTYAVYCHSGNRSAVAAAYLADHGFDAVYQLEGGITAWQAAGRPVTTD